MKKVFLLLVLFLTCCAPATIDPNQTHSLPTADWSSYQPSVEAFEFNEQCPHMCWLGINPGVTTTQEAQAILSASDQIDQQKTEISETGIIVVWFTEKTKKLDSSIYMPLKEGVVQLISFDRLAPFTFQNFANLLGEPDGINMDMNIYGDVMEMPYSVYFYSKEIVITGQSADTGPHANDPLASMTMNLAYNRKIFRTWVGYGHLAEYFAGKEFHQHPAKP